MSHLLSINSNKGKAINALKKYSNNLNVNIIGLGDSPNDLPLLLNADSLCVHGDTPGAVAIARQIKALQVKQSG